MVKLNYAQGKNEISNEDGVQILGSKAPNQQGLSPRELLEGAVALCLSITLENVLERDGIEVNLDEVAIEVVASKAEGVTNRFTDFTVHVTFPTAIDAAYQRKLLKVIERGCTISNTLIGDVQFEINSK